MSFIDRNTDDNGQEQSQDSPSAESSHNGQAEDAGDNGTAPNFNGGGSMLSGEEDGEVPFDQVVEEKKPTVSATTMMMIAVSALGGLGVWLMMHRINSASAAPVNSESVQAKQTINAFLGGGSANIKSMETMLRNTERVVQQFLTYPSMTQVPLSDLHTNPFRLKAPKPAGATASASEAAERRRREEERVKMLKAVQSLQLQSIMYSDTRKACMIDNVMYREGQQVDAFTVEKITASSVVVRGGVYRFELKMQR